MKVGVDATSWTNRRGYGRFARNAVGRLVELDTDSRYTLFIDEPSAREAELPAAAVVCAVQVSRAPSEAASAQSYRPLADVFRLSRAASRAHLDVMLFPSIYTWFPVVGTPTVVGVHDLIAEELPELTFPSRAARARWRLKRSSAMRSARRVFTVSETSRTLIAERLGVPKERIAVVPEAPEGVFGPRSQDAIDAELHALGLDRGASYLVYAGGVSPHKRLDVLFDAFATLVARVVPAPRLVVVGALDDEAYLSSAADVRRRIEELGLTERVILPGHVSDETLACLYAGALAFVSPSASEGFGLPAVEAAASGTAVVLSDIPAHRESLGDAAFYVPVGDSAGLADALFQIVGDRHLRRRLEAEVLKAVAGLTWDAAGRKLEQVLREAVGG